MSARRLTAVGAGTGLVTYLLLAPFHCSPSPVPNPDGSFQVTPAAPSDGFFQSDHCRGLVAFEYHDANFLAPQTIITAIIVGLLVALLYWLIASRPKAAPGVKPIISLVLVVLTLLFGASLGGGMLYAAPALIPLYWWMAHQSGRVARILWSLLAGIVAFYASSLLVYLLWSVALTAGVAVAMAIGASVIVYLAPHEKEPDPWARPPRRRGPRTMAL